PMLRIIGGTARGIRIKTPDTTKTRPTQDRVKESVFNMLMPYIEDTKVLDLFAGSGNLGLEALSRGAQKAVFIDESKLCRSIIEENLQKAKLEEKGTVLTAEVTTGLQRLSEKGETFDLVFMDPPYNMNFVVKTLHNLEKFDIINEDGIVACEHHEDETPPETVGNLTRVRFKTYGDTCFSFYVKSKGGNLEEEQA
ncbi:MAG: 16S rRNA (guanine(966)-N(2))-methyltransferase RsmD, partial [Clostridia bacterium]|nr:16S rRNA (guanine(966)-N(2))-methyltransferase RsmD [Clostridia bacterium]